MRGDTGWSLSTQLISLLDAEPVLLVDHNQAQLVELHSVMQQRMSSDHNADLAVGDLGTDLFLLRRRHRSGEQSHPGGVIEATELAAQRQWTQHRTDRSDMLCRKDFSRSQQGALVAGIDHLQHRQHSDDGLARAYFALQQPVHRPGAGQFGGEHLTHVSLTGGQLKR